MEYGPNKKEFYTAITLGILGVLVFVIFGVVTYREVGRVQEEIGKSGDMETNLETALKLKRVVSDLGSQVQTLDSFFVKSGEEPYFLEELDKLAKSNNVKLATDSVGVTGDGGGSGFETLNVNLKCEGSFDNVIGFLKSVQNMSKATTLSSINLTANEGTWLGIASLSVYKIK